MNIYMSNYMKLYKWLHYFLHEFTRHPGQCHGASRLPTATALSIPCSGCHWRGTISHPPWHLSTASMGTSKDNERVAALVARNQDLHLCSGHHTVHPARSGQNWPGAQWRPLPCAQRLQLQYVPEVLERWSTQIPDVQLAVSQTSNAPKMPLNRMLICPAHRSMHGQSITKETIIIIAITP